MYKLVIFLFLFVFVNAQSPNSRCPTWDDPFNPTLLPHPYNCAKFLKCSNGLAFPINCPSGQHFSIHLNRCDWPSIANCTLNSAPRCPPNDNPMNPTLLPHPYDCTRFYMCVHGHPNPMSCPPGQHFGVHINRCDWPETAQCNLLPRCPPNNDVPTFFPHPTKCDHFYVCNWGTPELRRCPANQHWWQDMRRCDWIWMVNCVPGGTTTTSRPTSTSTTRPTSTTRSTTTRRSVE